ncbi:hypothetical protein XELAEV_18047333mg [Xenopus laevis]|uniref:Uncharacterized protein n=1 Tax=Xenopus laevis TaxID=8355 RepID=A0A974H1F8_XENLA|nr:hypothetical protein XELAEV_18047333mg [Xenopus laevis]
MYQRQMWIVGSLGLSTDCQMVGSAVGSCRLRIKTHIMLAVWQLFFFLPAQSVAAKNFKSPTFQNYVCLQPLGATVP